MTYEFLQQYWWFLVSLLGALLVFLMFVQGANSLVWSLGTNETERRLIVNSTGRKWEFTFTTLVTFGGAFFASFPLFYSTSFGGAYWLWMLILLSFVLQAVSYEFQNKLGNLLGAKTFQLMLILNGILGPLLLGGAVATFFEGSNFIVEKNNITDMASPVISQWANASHGLDALLNPWVLVLGFAVFFLARILGILYVINNVNDENIRSRASVRLVGATICFLVLFVSYLVHLLLKDGYAYADDGQILIEPNKYLHNFLEMWYLLVLLLVGVVLVLYGIIKEMVNSKSSNSKSVCAGIAVHESQPSAYTINKKLGYITYADALDTPKGQNGQLYIGVLFPEKMKALRYLPMKEKKSGAVGHVIGQAPYRENTPFTYYAGSAWSQYDVPNQQVWDAVMQSEARALKQPLEVSIQ